jgi:hypothetical protein
VSGSFGGARHVVQIESVEGAPDGVPQLGAALAAASELLGQLA